MKYASLDAMIEHKVDKMFGDPWMRDEIYAESAGDAISTKVAWDELSGIHGQVTYRGSIFVIHHEAARQGMGGMDEGSPESVVVYRVKEGK